MHKFPKSVRFDNASYYVKDESKNKMDIDEPANDKKETTSKRVQLNKNQKTKMFAAAAKNPVSINSNSNVGQPTSSSVPRSFLAFIPRQVQKSYTKALTKNQSNERNVLETETMMDLVKSLPE